MGGEAQLKALSPPGQLPTPRWQTRALSDMNREQPETFPMSWLQIASLAFAFLSPVALWAMQRRNPDPRFERFFARCYAGLLIAVFLAGPLQRYLEGCLDMAHMLPMHLCDWALVAVVVALLRQSPVCFELAYFWGLCGTLQALFTPAITPGLEWWRLIVFFLDHAAIVAGVIFLLLVTRMRPRALWNVLLWSEIYLLAALAVNAWTGANYGFLAHPPATPSMLDLFSNTHWLYVVEINGVGLLFFAGLYAPWMIVDRIGARRVAASRAASNNSFGGH
jgi:hypothetical integral membrane protein (TIGR02206 family)